MDEAIRVAASASVRATARRSEPGFGVLVMMLGKGIWGRA